MNDNDTGPYAPDLTGEDAGQDGNEVIDADTYPPTWIPAPVQADDLGL